MYKKLLSVVLFWTIFNLLNAAYFKALPYSITQPNGEKIECFVSGDEYFNFIHDSEGYTIIQDNDGYYYYAINDSKGKVIPSKYLVNSIKPENVGLQKNIRISKEDYYAKVKFYDKYNKTSKAPHSGTLNNLVVYIKFSGDTEFEITRQVYDDKLNPSTGISLKSYYKEVSYDKLSINSKHYPICDLTTNISYTDSHVRNYFRPYNETTNPLGYADDTERTAREHQLLVDAITGVKAEVESSMSADALDGDSDGDVDNVTFIIKGNNDAWAELLWAHRWVLYSQTIQIKGKRVYDYTFQPESQNDVYTLCHEMFHALGAPDLYHYEESSISPIGNWGLMESGFVHMSAYMKWKYAGQVWIEEIPEITSSGYYTLNPLTSSTNNAYKIASPNSVDEFFVVEYRKNTNNGSFEANVPGSGLLVYRINSLYNGNAEFSFDVDGAKDEVYLYRPNGLPDANGMPNSANYSISAGRASITDATNSSSFLTDGSEGGLNISEIGEIGETITFKVQLSTLEAVKDFKAEMVANSSSKLSWKRNTKQDSVLVAYSLSGEFGSPVINANYKVGDEIDGGGTILSVGVEDNFVYHSNLLPGTAYYYSAWSFNKDLLSTASMDTVISSCGDIIELPYTEDFENGISTCWPIVDNIGTGYVWLAGKITGVFPNFTTEGNGYAYFNSDAYGNDNKPYDSELHSITFDFTAYKNVNVEFEHYMKHYGEQKGSFLYSTNGGENWTELQNWMVSTLSTSKPDTFKMDLSAELAGMSNVIFSWRFESSWDYYWAIDDFKVSGEKETSYLVASPKELVVDGNAGTSEISILSNLDWTASIDQTWATVTTSGSGDGTIEIQFPENTGTDRLAEITISATGVSDQIVNLTQIGLSNENDIISFEIVGMIGDATIDSENHTISIDAEASLNLHEVYPVIDISDYASISEDVTAAQDFSEPVVYTVISESGLEQEWTITVSKDFEELAVFDIQYSDEESGDSPYLYYLVKTTAIVTATTENGYFIQEQSYVWSGIYVYDPVNSPEVGDEVVIIAEVVEYFGLTELKEVSSFHILTSGNEIPLALPVSTFNAQQEKYEGVLVQLYEAVCVDADVENNFGMWTVNNGTGDLLIDDDIFAYTPVLDNKYHMKGIVHYSFDEFKVLPRSAEDISDITGIQDMNIIDFVLYPNPTTGMLTIEIVGSDNAEVDVLNIQGQVIKTVRLNNGENNLDISELNQGIYFVKVKTETGQNIRRVVLQ